MQRDPRPNDRYRETESLRDGTRVEIRDLRPEDRAGMLDAFGRMSEQSRYYRFFSPKHGFSDAETVYYMNADFASHVALVAVVDHGGARQIVAGGRYIVSQPGRAEIAFAVDDAHQGLGIASALVRHLAAIARGAGLSAFHAEVLADNTAMLKVFEKSGLGMSVKREQGTVQVALTLK
jgi:RimJ/RimL family protein N-acetyltransferase